MSGEKYKLDLAAVPVWAWFGVGIYGFLFFTGNALLTDPDIFWHMKFGQSILDTRILPQVDTYSFTKLGEPWISSSWLAQVLFAGAYDIAGWMGPVFLASATIAAAFALMMRSLGRYVSPIYACFVAIVAFKLSSFHFFARPHALAMPVMVAWVSGLVYASDSRKAPSWWLLPLMTLWTNLHGSFVFGLALVAPFALDGMWNAEAARRKSLALHWAGFAVAAVLASLVTPYGWDSLLAARKILGLGELLSIIAEWRPANFSHFGGFEACLLGLIALSLYKGIVLSPTRILLVLGLLHMALSHVRNFEIFLLLTPMVLAQPLAAQLPQLRSSASETVSPAIRLLLVSVLCGVTAVLASTRSFTPIGGKSVAGVIAALKDHHAKRVLNDYFMSGSLIAAGIPVFVDSRAELYGEKFVIAYDDALRLRNVDGFLKLLQTYNIDATLLGPSTPAVYLLDHLSGWRRVYTDDVGVVHVRVADHEPAVTAHPGLK